MLTLPKVVERAAQPYVAIRRIVQIPFGDVVDTTLPKLFEWVGRHGIEPAGPPMFKYNVIDMARDMEIDFGVPTASLLAPDETVVTGILPAGRYATLTHHGHYNELIEATAVLIGWCNLHRYAFDMEPTPAGDRFASRLELYPNDPREVPDPANWETVLLIKLRD